MWTPEIHKFSLTNRDAALNFNCQRSRPISLDRSRTQDLTAAAIAV